MPHLPIRMHKF